MTHRNRCRGCNKDLDDYCEQCKGTGKPTFKWWN